MLQSQTVVASAENKVLYSFPGYSKVWLDFSFNFLVADRSLYSA